LQLLNLGHRSRARQQKSGKSSNDYKADEISAITKVSYYKGWRLIAAQLIVAPPVITAAT
jgi:hypothetical protein